MTTSAQLRHRDGLPGHWTETTGERPLSPASVTALLCIGIAGCVTAASLVLRLYPIV
ncbi:MAG: hypothetical protein JSR69_06580 [Proteobacteria bacterium]|nr:hypothetical protein [Pseudomonadota bacterium]